MVFASKAAVPVAEPNEWIQIATEAAIARCFPILRHRKLAGGFSEGISAGCGMRIPYFAGGTSHSGPWIRNCHRSLYVPSSP